MPSFLDSLPSTPAVALSSIANQVTTLFSTNNTRSPYFSTTDRTPLFPVRQNEIAELKTTAQQLFTIHENTVAADDSNTQVPANLRIVRNIIFDPTNDMHKGFISRCVADCKQKLDRLEEADALMITGFTTGIVTSWFNFIPVVGWAGFAGWLCGAYHWQARQHLNEEYRESLHLLVAVMNWSLYKVPGSGYRDLSAQLLGQQQKKNNSLLPNVMAPWTASQTAAPMNTQALKDILDCDAIQDMANFLLPLLEEDRLDHLIDDNVQDKFKRQQHTLFGQNTTTTNPSGHSYQQVETTDTDTDTNDQGGQLTQIKFLNTQLSRDAATIRRKWYGYGNGSWSDIFVSCFGPFIDIAKRAAKNFQQPNQPVQDQDRVNVVTTSTAKTGYRSGF